MHSAVVKEAKEIFERAAHDALLSINEIMDARNYLLALITLKTGTRPGALANAHLHHYNSMRTDPTSKQKVLLIPAHKRGVDGPAPISLKPELQQLLSVWVTKIRPQLGSALPTNIFLASDGSALESKNISRRLPELWRKTGVRQDLRVTASNVRKWIVTSCHQKKTEGVEIDDLSLRRAMCHSTKTAETFYLREDMTAVAARAADIIEMCTTTEGAKKATVMSEESDRQDKTISEESETRDKEITITEETESTMPAISEDNATSMTEKEERTIEATSQENAATITEMNAMPSTPEEQPTVAKQKRTLTQQEKKHHF